jgi:hypothetical protein
MTARSRWRFLSTHTVWCQCTDGLCPLTPSRSTALSCVSLRAPPSRTPYTVRSVRAGSRHILPQRRGTSPVRHTAYCRPRGERGRATGGDGSWMVHPTLVTTFAGITRPVRFTVFGATRGIAQLHSSSAVNDVSTSRFTLPIRAPCRLPPQRRCLSRNCSRLWRRSGIAWAWCLGLGSAGLGRLGARSPSTVLWYWGRVVFIRLVHIRNVREMSVTTLVTESYYPGHCHY